MSGSTVNDYIRNLFLKKQGDPSAPDNYALASIIPSSTDDSMPPIPLAPPKNPVRDAVSSAIANKSNPVPATVNRTPAVIPDSTAVVEDDDKPAVVPGKPSSGFDDTMDTDALKNAQAHAAQDRFTANIGEAGNVIGHALARQDTPVDNSFYENMKKQADEPVKNIQALRQSTVQDQGQKAAAANADPNSDVSKGLQQLYITKFGMPADSISKLSADQIKEYQSPAELLARLQNTKAINDLKAQVAREKNAPGPSDLTGDYAKADGKLGDKLSTFLSRGENTRYGEALRRGTNIQALLNQAPGGDLNKLSLQQANLLTKEVDGFINGGAPTVAGVSHEEVNNWSQQFKALMQKTDNKPKPAELGAFIQQIVPYVGDTIENSRNFLYTNKKRIIDSHKSLIGPENYQRNMNELEQDFGKGKNLFTPGSSSAGPTPASAPAAMDPDAVTYAHMHNIGLDQAQKIIADRKRRGNNG